jgi:hypothetical protein
MSTASGPRGSLLLGMARELRRDQLGTHLRAMTAYADVVRLVAGPPGRRVRFHLVTHPDGVQQVLAGNAGNYVKDSRFYRELAAAVGDGLLTSDGERWRRQRRTLAPLFAHGRIGGYVPVMADEAVRLRRRWNATAGSPARVDLHAEMVEYTLRVVDPPPARLLAEPGAVRPRPVRPGRGVRAAPLRLVPLWRRPPRLHRGPVRAHRGGGGHRGPARRPRAAGRRRARAADHRHHPAPRGPGLVPGRRQAAGRYGAGGGPTISRPYLR